MIDQISKKLSEPLDYSRREFLRLSSLGCAGFSTLIPSLISADAGSDFPEEIRQYVKEAQYYEKLPHKKIRCTLCPRECVIDDRERGYCGVRENREGTYYSLVYARPCTYHVDPIEKKPLFHFHPGTTAFSIATAGCNVNCKFCQNWEISQVRPEQIRSIHMPPDKTAGLAKKNDCLSIAYTYSEPTIYFEYMKDTAIAGREMNVKSVVITAGYISEKPLQELCEHVDAIKVDLKAYSEKFYKEIVNGELKPVLNSLITMQKKGIWTEIVYLIVPTLNDDEKELTELCKWVRQYLGRDVPIHFTRFHPYYLLKNLPSTPVKTLERAWNIARSEGLNFVYIGNVAGHPAENTYCPGCGEIIISRRGYFIEDIKINNGHCHYCQASIAGKWQL